MARPRTPLSKARITGQTYSNSTRFKDRKEPRVTKSLGAPPRWMSAPQRKVWAEFTSELPWLNYSHRGIMEIACSARARMRERDDCNVANMTLLKQCLGALGASPADSSKVSVPDDPADDPADEYFK